jgi:two-component system, OmpR family, sensor kinase
MFSAIRQRLQLRSVRARLTFWYLLTLGGSLLAFSVFVWVVRARTLYLELDAELEVRAHQAAADLRPALLALDSGARLAQDPTARGAPLLVREAPGAVLFQSPQFPALDWRGERRLALAATENQRVVRVDPLEGAPVHVATLRVDRPGAGPVAVQVAQSTGPVRHILRQLALVMAAGLAAVLAIAGYGSGLTARRALAPVDAIVARARRIQAERPGDRLDVRAGSAELDRLVATLNEMLDRIEGSMRVARRFAADASHELQTPLTAMQATVEHGLRAPRDGEHYRAMALDLLEEIERCSTLVRDLRLLALAEGGHIVTRPEPVALLGLTRDCAEIARALAEPRRIRVEARVIGEPIVAGSALHLRRAILNLLDNAIRYSPAGATVSLVTAQAGDRASVEVRDTGCGIDAADLAQVFRPFYRADPARARETGGTGLGLSIAEQIARAHGGEIRVASVPGEGSTFVLLLPAA